MSQNPHFLSTWFDAYLVLWLWISDAGVRVLEKAVGINFLYQRTVEGTGNEDRNTPITANHHHTNGDT